jgi:hypothetical protein
MSNKKQLFADFFSNKIASDPGVKLPASEPRPHGWFEEFRAETFQTPHNPTLKTGTLWSKLSGIVYKIESSQLSVVLALYADTILWLDDHSNDTDFNAFVRREQVSKWLPQNIEALLDLLIATKFNFLGRPQLVRSALEIPTFSERQKALMAKSKEALTKLSIQEKDLAKIAEQIHPPKFISRDEGTFQLNFCLWTKILGKVIKIHCYFEQDKFRYEAILLAEQIGNFLVPS